MTTQVNEKYVLTEEEINLRNAIAFLKGCIVQFSINNGAKYTSTKNPSEDFTKGLEKTKPIEKTYSGTLGREYTYTIRPKRQWITICHIIHNRLRHDRPHTTSWNEDQEFLTVFTNDRSDNGDYVKAFREFLNEYNVLIPGLYTRVSKEAS